ncbi:MAG: bifunctional (p)ppGpp synthetase/guanosine-3',5'-bis(diphosphate) 3'-pyrophosphohydrolase, partial [Oscillospiraceae bacterium]|nr:bifunctional (p)ppGpp synthetase/guanosine-3',5'-bis(diphosphate) 3'-pyrophosphohydrolase [Oscillospiraceae bacterium]
MDPVLQRYHELENKIREYMPNADFDRLESAFHYADEHHAGQLRKDGTPYITHPLAVAEIVVELGLDQESIIAALLHDTIEDTDATYEDLARLYGTTVADLVDGVTKLTRVQYTSKEEEQMENLRKMLMAMAKDIRVILIKICDRLHNMRTMVYQSPRKQKEKALETMEIYAPIAHRLGMQKIKWELEDTSLQFLDPIGYQKITEELSARSSTHEEFMSTVEQRIHQRLEQEGVSHTIYGRIKHVYSVYRKMYSQNKTLDEIFDLYAFRVIVDSISDCYYVLGCIHDLYKPVAGRFKDYIGTPKPNGYQSLHTTVIGREGMPFEVQIRTQDMHQRAEYGVAAHWKYKQGLANTKLGSEATFEGVRRLLESQQDADPDEFVHNMKVDLFADEVFVFTPRGDVINLPAGATPIDFAYSIHSEVGNRMTGAKINGRIVTYDTKLSNGDIVEILTSKNAKGPSRDWVQLCRSNEARNKIRQWFKREHREENIVRGRAMLEQELKKTGLSIAAISTEELLPHILKKVRFNSLDDLYAAIGYGGMPTVKAVNRVRDEMIRQGQQVRDTAHRSQPKEERPPEPQPSVPQYSSTGSIV